MKYRITYLRFFAVFICVFLFITANLQAQEEYNFWALRYLRESINALFAGDYKEVINQSNLCLRIDPESSVSYTIRARAYYELGELDLAVLDCSQAISLDRNNLSAYSLRANVYARQGRMDRALSDWRMVLRIDPDNKIAQYNIEIASEAR